MQETGATSLWRGSLSLRGLWCPVWALWGLWWRRALPPRRGCVWTRPRHRPRRRQGPADPVRHTVAWRVWAWVWVEQSDCWREHHWLWSCPRDVVWLGVGVGGTERLLKGTPLVVVMLSWCGVLGCVCVNVWTEQRGLLRRNTTVGDHALVM